MQLITHCHHFSLLHPIIVDFVQVFSGVSLCIMYMSILYLLKAQEPSCSSLESLTLALCMVTRNILRMVQWHRNAKEASLCAYSLPPETRASEALQ